MGSSQSTGNDSGRTLTGLQNVGQHAQTLSSHLQVASETVKSSGLAVQQMGDTARGVYSMAMQHLAASGTTGGGSSSGTSPFGQGYFGGNNAEDPSKTVKEYRITLAAAAKDKIARGLVQALKSVGIEAKEGDSIEEIARSLQKNLPNPRRGKTFTADAKTQEKVCTMVAKALNNEFTPGASGADNLVDTTLGPVSVCRQVVELVHSLAVGVHTELLEVHASLKRVLKNLEVVHEVLREVHNKVLEEIKKGDMPEGADKRIEAFEELYRRALKEHDHQMSVLKNILHVTLAPAEKELALAMQEEGETHDMIRKLKLIPGTEQFGNMLAEAVSGLGSVATITTRVDRALKEVGMGITEYLESPDRKAFEKALDAKLMSGDSKKEVGKFLEAARTLRENFHRRSELDFEKAKLSEYSGGLEPLSTLDKRVERRKMERRLIVKEFIDKSTHQYDDLLAAINVLGPHLGKEIPLSEKLEALRNALARLSQSRLGGLNIELALIGFYSDAAARSKKETFLADIRVVRGVLEEIMSMEMYQGTAKYFAAMRAAIDGLIRTIDFYSDIITKKYGSGEDEKKEAKVGGQDELTGMPEMARSSYDLDRAVNTFLYFYFVAKVRSNLRTTHKELEHYGEKYQNILGDAVAARIRVLLTEKAARLTSVTSDPAKKLIEKEYSCKVEFYRALQALDLYMKAFTDGIVAKPDDVKDVKRILDGVSVIGRWFTEETGDNLAAAFDLMPGFDGVARTTPDVTVNSTTQQPRTGHYYEKVVSSTLHPATVAVEQRLFTPGIPQLAVSADKADAINSQIGKVYDHFQALKNIMNAFVRIGDRFGGQELRRKVFMSPTQIYKALIDYLKCSAISMGVDLPAGNSPTIDVTGAPAVVSNAAPAGAPALAPGVSQLQANAKESVYFGSCIAAVQGKYAVEDRYFSFCVKAMAAKVLTVTGVYDLFERPSPVYELTPTRMIIGGTEYDAAPEVIPEATELYFRLPRLVEFYKDLFNFKSDKAVQISMLPEMEGVFSGIIRLIFQRVQAGASESGDYSDIECQQMVREVNTIYSHFRGSAKSGAVAEALASFVMEINRRYGIVKREEWDTLQKLLREVRGSVTDFGDLNRTNYSILPDEEEYEGTRRAPSDRYLGPSGETSTAFTSKFRIDDNDWSQWGMLSEFRQKLDGFFANVAPEEFTTYTFSTVIRQGELEMRQAQSPNAKLAIATRLIQGSGSLAGIDMGKAFMFHETVVVGLNLLNAIYTILSQYRQRVIDLDVKRLMDAVKRWADKSVAAGGPGAAIPAVNALPAIPAGITAAKIRRVALDGFTTDAKNYIRDDALDFFKENGASFPLTAANLYNSVWESIQAAPAQADMPGILGTLAAHCFDADSMMEDLIQVISGLTVNFQGLVSVRYPNTASGNVHLDFSGLRGVVQSLRGDIQFFMDMFRPHIAKSVIQKFEDLNVTGSFYWLEKNLFDSLIRGLPDDQMRAESTQQKTVDWMSRSINQTYGILIGYTQYSLAQVTGVGSLVVTNGGDTPVDPKAPGPIPAVGVTPVAQSRATGASYYRQYGRLFSRLTFYDATSTTNKSAVAAENEDYTAGPFGSGVAALIATARPGAPVGGTPAIRALPAAATAPAVRRFGIWSSQAGLLSDRSLMMAFNQIIAKYLQVFYDGASGKIYRPLIDAFANGAFSRAVMSPGNTMPDLVATQDTTFGIRGDPTGQGILAQSLGLILQRLATDISPSTQISDHLVATLSEIPLYIRESFRANLPGFIKLFEMLQQKGTLYKQLLSQTRVQCGRPFSPAEAAGVPAITPNIKIRYLVAKVATDVTDVNTANYPVGSTTASIETLISSPKDSDQTKSRILRVIDTVAAGCYSMSNAAGEVLRELADEPLYLQTQENSTREYESRYGKKPLMPLSTALTFLRDLTGEGRLLPENSAGDVNFKLMYGTRKLLGRPTFKFTLADAPGIRANLEAFNAAAVSREKIDPGRYQNFLTNAVTVLRYVADMRYYGGVLAPTGPRGDLLRVSLLNTADNAGIKTTEPNANAAYSIRVEPIAAVETTESSSQDQELRKISDVVGGAVATLGRDRRKEWIYNIIDMNIIPVNVHALMRGIPLAPLYNYVYTFEQMACIMFGETVSGVKSKIMDPRDPKGLKNTKQMFLRLLINPYEEIPTKVYGGTSRELGTAGLVSRIFRGDDSLMMGRPKFLSDQIFNKSLFGSLVPTKYDYDEAGPATSAALRRGHQGVGGKSVGLGVLPPSPGVPGDVLVRGRIGLSYIGEPTDDGGPETAIKYVDLGVNDYSKLAALDAIGKLRFDTRLVRNLVFIANVQRLMRLKLNQELTQYRNVLVSNHSVVNPGVTEYGYMSPSMSKGPDPQTLPTTQSARVAPGPMETSTSRLYDNDRRLVQ